jgi:hypothetical protein
MYSPLVIRYCHFPVRFPPSLLLDGAPSFLHLHFRTSLTQWPHYPLPWTHLQVQTAHFVQDLLLPKGGMKIFDLIQTSLSGLIIIANALMPRPIQEKLLEIRAAPCVVLLLGLLFCL